MTDRCAYEAVLAVLREDRRGAAWDEAVADRIIAAIRRAVPFGPLGVENTTNPRLSVGYNLELSAATGEWEAGRG